MDDAKEETKQEPTQRPAAPSPEAYHSARRGKRMKSEVRVAADGTSIDQEQLVHIPFFLLQPICVKMEPGDPGENRPNLRRRMGSIVTKQEPGEALAPDEERAVTSAPLFVLLAAHGSDYSSSYCGEKPRLRRRQCQSLSVSVCDCLSQDDVM